MSSPLPSPLRQGLSQEEYRELFVNEYCRRTTVFTVDSATELQIRFKPDMFAHAFFESSDRKGADDVFSEKRAERMLLISSLLDDNFGERYFGWDKQSKSDSVDRCVLVHNRFDFVVVVEFFLSRAGEIRGRFVTCYVADSWESLPKIRKHEKWDYEVLKQHLANEKIKRR